MSALGSRCGGGACPGSKEERMVLVLVGAERGQGGAFGTGHDGGVQGEGIERRKGLG